jgi:sarcosine oxidase subunit alpha
VFERRAPIRDKVSFSIDGRTIDAARGEPLAIALLAAGEGALARSPKLHRPRGPACLRGDCDGCLARVDGVPNVMTCMRDARGGEVIEAQNVLGSRKIDLLRLTDWFFPKGIDHHHLMAGIPGAQTVMQTVARQMAGIGKLPDEDEPVRPAERLTCDVLVVGAGLSGLACAATLVARGLEVTVVDDGPAPGGSALAAGKETAARARALADGLGDRVRPRTTCAGFYDADALLAGPTGAAVVTPRIAVTATGAHDGFLVAPGNDLPGVIGARAVAALAARGIVPKAGAVVVGAGPWAELVATALGDRVLRRVAEADIETIHGGTEVEGVTLRGGEAIACGVLAVATPLAPSFELAEQRGAGTERIDAGYAVAVDETGRAAAGLYAVGECTGMTFDPQALVAAGERVAASIEGALT